MDNWKNYNCWSEVEDNKTIGLFYVGIKLKIQDFISLTGFLLQL